MRVRNSKKSNWTSLLNSGWQVLVGRLNRSRKGRGTESIGPPWLVFIPALDWQIISVRGMSNGRTNWSTLVRCCTYTMIESVGQHGVLFHTTLDWQGDSVFATEVLTESIGPLSMTVGCVQIELTDSYGLCILNWPNQSVSVSSAAFGATASSFEVVYMYVCYSSKKALLAPRKFHTHIW